MLEFSLLGMLKLLGLVNDVDNFPPDFWESKSKDDTHEPRVTVFISSVCGVCVLKREHHCMFAGYCVGHFNHRFFVLFLAWLWLGVLYCTYLNSLYVWTGEN